MCSVTYDEDEQIEYSEQLLEEDITASNYSIFHMTTGDSYGLVSIGGIAGYSENGVIIDSYSKVNVLKPTAYIAGGIVGVSEDYNYIAYTYNTGAVYGQFLIGGIAGLQINTKSIDSLDNPVYDYLVMYKNTSLVDWNHKTNNYDHLLSDTLS